MDDTLRLLYLGPWIFLADDYLVDGVDDHLPYD